MDGHQHKKLTVFLCLINSSDLIGERPKQETGNDTSPHLSHYVKNCITPVTDDGQRSSCSCGKHCSNTVNESMRVKSTNIGVNNHSESSEKQKEWYRTDVEDILLIILVTKLRVQCSETLFDDNCAFVSNVTSILCSQINRSSRNLQ